MHLTKAFKVQDDELYTLYKDIETEMNVYLDYNPNVFRDKVILLPCDDPTKSNFTKYFINNFNKLGLKKLISTGFAKDGTAHYVTGFEGLFGDPDNPDFLEKSKGKCLILNRGDPDNVTPWEYLEGDGDFRSPEITKLRDQSDIIITNPPFSLFREFMTWVVKGGWTSSICRYRTFTCLRLSRHF